jgi:hypothetical protein
MAKPKRKTMARARARSETTSVATDPLRAAADTVALAAEAAKEGARDARDKVADRIPGVGEFMNRATYNSCYAISFAVVLPTLLLAHALPKENVIVYGLVDGARAARDALAKRGGQNSGAESVE